MNSSLTLTYLHLGPQADTLVNNKILGTGSVVIVYVSIAHNLQ